MITHEGEAKRQQTEDWLKKFGIDWLTGIGSPSLKEYGVSGIPCTFVIGADGKVAWNSRVGGTMDAALDKALEAAKK